jgi:hypothetical protein
MGAALVAGSSRQIRRAGIATEDTYSYVTNRAEGEGITGRDLEGPDQLVLEPIQVDRCAGERLRDCGEGQHRSHAMMRYRAADSPDESNMCRRIDQPCLADSAGERQAGGHIGFRLSWARQH